MIESQGQVVDVGGDFDYVWIEQCGDFMDWFGQGSDGSFWVCCQVGCYLVDECWGDQWFVVLDVDYDGIVGQVELGSDFFQVIGVGVVFGMCQQCFGVEFLVCCQDVFVVGGDDYVVGGVFVGLVLDVLDYWLVGDIL